MTKPWKSLTQQRADTIPALSRLLRSPQWREAHPERRQTVITVLPEDTVSYLLGVLDAPDQLDEAAKDTEVSAPPLLAIVTSTGLRVVRLVDEGEWRQ